MSHEPPAAEPNRKMGPWTVGDNVPEFEFTVIGLADPTIFDGAEIKISDSYGNEVALGAVEYEVTADETTVTVVATPPDTAVFSQVGMHKGDLSLFAGTRRFTMQPWVFEVRDRAGS